MLRLCFFIVGIACWTSASLQAQTPPAVEIKPKESLQPFKILDSDDEMLKLKKMRFNSALAAFRAVNVDRLADKITFNSESTSHFFIGVVRNMTHAALDMNDRKFSLRYADDLMQTMESVNQHARSAWEAGKMAPSIFYLLESQYYDAKILRARLQQQKGTGSTRQIDRFREKENQTMLQPREFIVALS